MGVFVGEYVRCAIVGTCPRHERSPCVPVGDGDVHTFPERCTQRESCPRECVPRRRGLTVVWARTDLPMRLPGPYFDTDPHRSNNGSAGTQREDDSVSTASDPDGSVHACLHEALAGDQLSKKSAMQ